MSDQYKAPRQAMTESTQPDRGISAIRVLHYTYPNRERYEEDRERWTTSLDADRLPRGPRMDSAVMVVEHLDPDYGVDALAACVEHEALRLTNAELNRELTSRYEQIKELKEYIAKLLEIYAVPTGMASS